jgi:serine/threonine protein kinase
MPDQQETRLDQQVGEYRLVRRLGGGGFGTVYLAERVHDHMQAAVKILHIPLAESEDFKDFINEARTMRLRHPHIVPLLDFGISRDDLPFLVMEYAPKGTLRDRHPRGERVPLSTIVSYVDQLASALQYAHDQHVIHRDIKPANILVRTDGTLMVSDFGIAKFLEQSLLISMQKLVGTPEYMAPEQHKGKPCFASDQYTLAVVVYEWICGVRPFQGTALGLAIQHMNTLPPSPRDHLPELSEDVERVILKALAKAPEDRFERIQEFADALREAVQPPLALSPPIESINTTPLASPQQVSLPASTRKPETLVHALTDTEAARLKPRIQTADIPVSHQGPTAAFPLTPPEPLINAAPPSPEKRPPGRRFSFLTRRSLGIVLLLVVLVVALFSGGTYYVLQSVKNSFYASQLTNAHTLIDRANAESAQNPIDALQQLSLAQKALLGAQGPVLVGDQASQYNTLKASLRNALQKAMTVYNQKELITQLSCSTQSFAISGNAQPVSLRTMQENGTSYSYVLATDHNLYQLDEQHQLKRFSSGLASNATLLDFAGNGQHLFALISLPGPSYRLSLLSFDQAPNLKEENQGAVDSKLVTDGWTPVYVTASGNEVSLILTGSKFPHQAMLLSYDAANLPNPPHAVRVALSADMVSVAAFPNKQLFFLTSDGHVKRVMYGDGGNAEHPDDLSLQNPVSPPLANDPMNFSVDTPIVTAAPSYQVVTSAQSGSTLLVASSASDNPHLYVVDNLNHRILDLKFVPGQSVNLTPSPTPTAVAGTPTATPTPSAGAGVFNPAALKLLQQFASTSILSSVKSATVSADGKDLYLLTQGGGTHTTISSIDKVPSC